MSEINEGKREKNAMEVVYQMYTIKSTKSTNKIVDAENSKKILTQWKYHFTKNVNNNVKKVEYLMILTFSESAGFIHEVYYMDNTVTNQ